MQKRILIVCSGTSNMLSPFISEQIDSLKKYNYEFQIFQINKKGILGYLSSLLPLVKVIKEYNPVLIHAHYGLSSLLANLQFRVPVITTFHGSDINNIKVNRWSRISHILSFASIFVSEDIYRKSKKKKRSFVIPCGVDTNTFNNSGEKLVLSNLIKANSYNILFSSAFSNRVKNYELAKNACRLAEKSLDKKINLIELNGYNRFEVNQIMNSVDCMLLTSFSEGSPQFIKEAMACSKPIVSTKVGDVEYLFGDLQGHFLTTFEVEDVSSCIIKALDFHKEVGYTKGRNRIIELKLDIDSISKRIIEVYRLVN